MTIERHSAWAALARADGATRQLPLMDALRSANMAALEGTAWGWMVVNVAPTMEEAAAHNRELKRRIKTRMERRHEANREADGDGHGGVSDAGVQETAPDGED